MKRLIAAFVALLMLCGCSAPAASDAPQQTAVPSKTASPQQTQTVAEREPQELTVFRINDKSGAVNAKGELVYDFTYDYLVNVGEGVIVTARLVPQSESLDVGMLYSLGDSYGNISCVDQITMISANSYYLCRKTTGNKEELINGKTGAVLLNDTDFSVSDSLSVSDKALALTRDGKVLIYELDALERGDKTPKKTYDGVSYAYASDGGFLIVTEPKQEGLASTMGLLDANGELLVDYGIYNYVDPGEGSYLVQKDLEYYYLDEEQKELPYGRFYNAMPFENGTAIVTVGKPNEDSLLDGKYTEEKYTVIDKNGKQLFSDNFNSITRIGGTGCFYAERTGVNGVIVSPEGKLSEIPMPDESGISNASIRVTSTACNRYFIVGVYYTDATRAECFATCVLDPVTMEIVVPYGKYLEITGYEGEYMIASRKPYPKSISVVYDAFSSSGEQILKNARYIDGCDDTHFVCQKGAKLLLMDTAGNVIYEASAYTGLED